MDRRSCNEDTTIHIYFGITELTEGGSRCNANAIEKLLVVEKFPMFIIVDLSRFELIAGGSALKEVLCAWWFQTRKCILKQNRTECNTGFNTIHLARPQWCW